MNIIRGVKCPSCELGAVVESADQFGELVRCMTCGWLGDIPQGWTAKRVIRQARLQRQMAKGIGAEEVGTSVAA